MSDADLEMVLDTFPGADVEETPAPPARSRRDTSGAVDELIEAVEEMVGFFGREEPARLERGGWKRIEKALAAAKAAVRVDPDQVGGAPAQANHPPTAKVAASIVSAGTQQHMVLCLLAQADATAYELAAESRFQRLRPNIPPNQVASRIDELRTMGCVERLHDEQERVVTREAAAGPADVWTLTAHGETELLRLGPHAVS